MTMKGKRAKKMNFNENIWNSDMRKKKKRYQINKKNKISNFSLAITHFAILKCENLDIIYLIINYSIK